MYLGHILHPQIPITEGMKIAELGTGTGYILPDRLRGLLAYANKPQTRIWLFDASRNLPPTVELHGYDLSDGQFPARHLWPENVTLGVMDSLIDPPSNLVGQYDIVHLRMWASNLKENDTAPVLEHAKKLLSK